MTRICTAVALLGTLIPAQAHAETFVDVGLAASKLESRIAGRPDTVDRTDTGVHVGIGGRRPVGERAAIGIRLELDTIDSDLLLAVRALDYRRHRPGGRLAWSLFAGAARLDLATPAWGWYLGGGIEIGEIVGEWSLNMDVRYGDKLARDNVLPTDPQGGSPDNFHDVTGVSLYLSRKF